MIRRTILVAAVFVGTFLGSAGAAHAANGYIACLYAGDPLHVGLCMQAPQAPHAP